MCEARDKSGDPGTQPWSMRTPSFGCDLEAVAGMSMDFPKVLRNLCRKDPWGPGIVARYGVADFDSSRSPNLPSIATEVLNIHIYATLFFDFNA